MRVLLDNGIFSHAEFMEHSKEPKTVRWGTQDVTADIEGLKRKKLDKKQDYQAEKNALFTIGRLIREGRITAYNYTETQFEGMRGRIRIQTGNALSDCTFQRCPSALERTKFRGGDYRDVIAKGGKKDFVKKGRREPCDTNQIPFFEWLCRLNQDQIDGFLLYSTQIGLTDFEIESLKGLKLFQYLCTESANRENYPDAFHLWTAERNGLDVLLTLDFGLSKLSSRVQKKEPTFHAKALLPLSLLEIMGIKELDPVPVVPEKFYSLLD